MSSESFDFETNLRDHLSAHHGHDVPVEMIGEPVRVAGNATAAALSYEDDKGSWVEGNLRIVFKYSLGLPAVEMDDMVMTHRWSTQDVLVSGHGNLAEGVVDKMRWFIDRERTADPKRFIEAA